jgi:hypothetical protein
VVEKGQPPVAYEVGSWVNFGNELVAYQDPKPPLEGREGSCKTEGAYKEAYGWLYSNDRGLEEPRG